MSRVSKLYKGYKIEINMVPSGQFSFGGFGWAYRVTQGRRSCVKMVMKGDFDWHEKMDREQILEMGWKYICGLIDNGKVSCNEEKRYCFVVMEDLSIKSVDCEGFMRG